MIYQYQPAQANKANKYNSETLSLIFFDKEKIIDEVIWNNWLCMFVIVNTYLITDDDTVWDYFLTWQPKSLYE